MADELSLLWRIRAQADVKPAVAETRAAVAQIRQSLGQTSSDFRQIQNVSTRSLGAIVQSLTQVSSRIPVVGGAVSGLSSELGSMATAATSSAGSLGLIAGASILAVSAITGVAKAIFDLTVQSADFQGKLFDSSQQLGISVETLSAFEILAKTTGGTLDGISASLGIFQKNLEDAQDPTSKEAALLKSLGVEAKDTEQALRQTLTRLAAMPEGFQQTALALELFGRGGKQILAILKEMDGDLDGAIKKFREMGILIGTDSARAADKFNDQLAILQFQLRGLVGVIGNEAMPEISAAIQQVSQLVTDNQGVIRAWVSDIGDAARGALILADAIRTIGGAVTGLGRIPIPQILLLLGNISGATGILRGLTALGDRGPFAGVVGGVGPVRPEGAGIRRPSGGGGRGGGGAPRDTFLADATKQAELTEREALQAVQADIEENKRALDQQIRDIEEFTTRATQLANQRLQVEIRSLNAQEAALIEALNKRKIKAEEFDTKLRELEIDRAKVRQANSQETFKLESDRDRQISQAQIAAKRRQLEIAEEADKRQIARIENRVREELILESEAEKQIAAIIDEGFQRRRKVLEDEQDQYATTLERRKEIYDELIRLDGERAGAAEDAGRRISAAVQSESRAHQEALRDSRERTVQIDREAADTALALLGLTGVRRREIFRAELRLRVEDEVRRHQLANESIINQRIENEQSARTQQQKLERAIEINKEEEAEERRHQLEMQRLRVEGQRGEAEESPIGQALEALRTGQIPELEGGIKNFADVATVALGSVFAAIGQLSQGVGQLVNQWVLMGTVGPNAFRKLAATILASVAQQAAVLAIMSLAYAALASTAVGAILLGGTPAQFLQAAALFGAVAAVAAIAGRAVAGGAFQQQAAGTGPSGGTNQRSERDRTIREPRTGGAPDPTQPQVVGQVEVLLKYPDGYVETQMVRIYDRNGSLRGRIRSDVLGEANG